MDALKKGLMEYGVPRHRGCSRPYLAPLDAEMEAHLQRAQDEMAVFFQKSKAENRTLTVPDDVITLPCPNP